MSQIQQGGGSVRHNDADISIWPKQISKLNIHDAHGCRVQEAGVLRIGM